MWWIFSLILVLKNRGKFTVLEDTSCRIKPGCTEHPPWPGGICTKCQPSAITLKRQVSCWENCKTAHEWSAFYFSIREDNKELMDSVNPSLNSLNKHWNVHKMHSVRRIPVWVQSLRVFGSLQRPADDSKEIRECLRIIRRAD